MNDSVKELRNILENDPDQLAGVVSELGEKKFRAIQVFGWLSKGVTDFDDMGNIPKAFREKLKENYCIDIPSVVYDQQSRTDGTRKCLFEFRDGSRVESVFMKYSYGNSICISSQVGCRMGCTFCASTRKGLERSLAGGEMLAQVLAMRNLTGEEINHIVVMGIGEPFDNYDNLAKFLKLIHHPKGYGLSLRNITVSTCGLIPGIERFAREFPQVNLAVSLHAPNQEIRQKSMPVAKKYDYDELIQTCKDYAKATGRRVTFEYALIDGLNDSKDNALELAQHLRGFQAHVNLIPLNPVEGTGYNTSHRDNVERFRKMLEEKHIAVTVRRTLGSDIDAACGQLRLR